MSDRLRALLVFGALLGLVGLASCSPAGQTCPSVGSVKTYKGHVYQCQAGTDGGSTWQ